MFKVVFLQNKITVLNKQVSTNVKDCLFLKQNHEYTKYLDDLMTVYMHFYNEIRNDNF